MSLGVALINGVELRLLVQPSCGGKKVALHSGETATAFFRRRRTSDTQPFATLGTTTSKNLTTAFRRHTRAKPVCSLAVYVTWLVCTLHDFRCPGRRRSSQSDSKSALKQRDGGPKERRQGYAPTPRVSSNESLACRSSKTEFCDEILDSERPVFLWITSARSV